MKSRYWETPLPANRSINTFLLWRWSCIQVCGWAIDVTPALLPPAPAQVDAATVRALAANLTARNLREVKKELLALAESVKYRS